MIRILIRFRCLLMIYKTPLYKQKYPNKWLGKDLEEAVKVSAGLNLSCSLVKFVFRVECLN